MGRNIALIGLPMVGDIFRNAGLTVLGGTDRLVEDAKAAKPDLDKDPLMVVLAQDLATPGIKPWLTKTASTNPVYIMRSPDGSGISVPGATDIDTPCALDDVLATIDYPMVGGDLGATDIDLSSPVPRAPEPAVIAPTPAIPPTPPIIAPPEPPATDSMRGTIPSTPPESPFVESVSDTPWDDTTPTVIPVAEPPVDTSMPPVPAISPAPVPPVVQPRVIPAAPPSPPLPVIQPPAVTIPPAPPVAPSPSPPPAVVDDMADMFTTPYTSANAPRRATPGTVVISIAGKGGVGKSFIAISTATMLADAGYRVCLIDGNRLQGDQEKYLRIDRSRALSIYDAATGACTIRDVILTPETIRDIRPSELAPLPFAVVLTPPDDAPNPTAVTADVYMSVVAEARAQYDYVVIDTQIVEAADTSGLIDDMVIPLLREGGWAIGITDTSRPGVANLFARLSTFASEGVLRDHILVVTNQVPMDAKMIEDDPFSRHFTPLGDYLGSIYATTEVKAAMNKGESPYELSSVAPIIDTIGFKITGNYDLEPSRHERQQPKRRFGFLKRK